MIDNRLIHYLNLINSPSNELKVFYQRIIDFENIHFIPAVRLETALFLHWQAGILKPLRVLEIGFGSGASGIFIKKGYHHIKKFISLERDKNRYERGLRLLKNQSINGIELIKIDAFDFLESNKNKYDLIFLDSVKRDYIDYLPQLLPKLSSNGTLICDNILFNGRILEDDPGDKYRDGVELLKKFNTTLSTHKELFTHFLPIGDGLSISVKK